ncbi:MAG: hypothetical protein KDA61_07275, partial [Planctomycetales bacterium]|nr:hypothetical protein [Planctomycetales bacterium]
MTSWSVQPIGGWGVYLLLAAMLAALAAIGPRSHGLTPRRRLTLRALRVASLALLLLVGARPALETLSHRTVPGTLLVLTDRSRSMQVEDSLHDASRWKSAVEALDAAADQFEILEEAW